MTKLIDSKEVVNKIEGQFPQAIAGFDDSTIFINVKSISEVCRFLSQTPNLEFDFLANLTGVDYLDYFEIVYHLVSIKHNHKITLKTRCHDRNKPVVPSVTPIWMAADLQEREIYDLLGVRFEGHYNMKRLLLWEGFEGHPLRRDFL